VCVASCLFPVLDQSRIPTARSEMEGIGRHYVLGRSSSV